MRSFVLALVIVSFLPAEFHGQALEPEAADVSGRVIDEQTGRPLAGATVLLRRDERVVERTVVDDRGEFVIRDVDPGPAVLAVRLLGYRERRVEVRVGSERPELTVRLSTSPITLSPVEVIGRSPGAYQEIPGAAAEVEAPELELIRPTGTQELLETVPGIIGFADDGIGNSRINIGIRGLNPRRSSRLLVLEDGIPIQPAIYVYPNMYYNPPVERIDRVEVVKGSAAITHGPQTMGGVINYITSRPRDEFGGLGEVTTGTNGYLSVFGELGGWGGETWQPGLQLLYKRGDGFRRNNDFEQYNGTFKLTLRPDPERTVYIKANVNYENSNATYTGLTEYSFRTDPRFNPKEDDNFRIFRPSLDVLYTRELSDDLSATTKAYANLFDRRWWREKDIFVRAAEYEQNGAASPVPPYATGDLVRVGGGESNLGILRTFYVAGVEHAYTFLHTLTGIDGTLDVGARYHWERFIDDKKQGDRPDARDGVYYTGDPEDPATLDIVGQSHHYETSALSLYASETLDFGELRVVPGLRFELFEQERINRLQGSQYRDKTSHVVLPGVGLNYELGPYNIFGGVHRGYTPPSSGTLRIVSFGADAPAGGLDVEPEKSWNYELGLRGSTPWLGFEATGFYLAVEDLVAAGRGTAFKNLGRVRTWGAELAATLSTSALSGLLPDVHTGYTYLQTEVLDGRIQSAVIAGRAEVDISGNELPYAPRHTVTAGLSKDFGSGLRLRADAKYVDEAFTDFENIRKTYNRGDTGPIPAYTVVNASASYRVLDDLKATVVAKNLFDEVYIGSRLHSNPRQPQAHISSGIIPGPRRQINISLTYDL